MIYGFLIITIFSLLVVIAIDTAQKRRDTLHRR
jgi:hypothetical protein